jgi:hypothetical protein
MALDAMQRGERFADATIADYRNQLQNVKADRLRIEELLRVLWSQVAAAVKGNRIWSRLASLIAPYEPRACSHRRVSDGGFEEMSRNTSRVNTHEERARYLDG